MSKQMRGELNLLRLRQIYLNRKLSLGEMWRLPELKKVHLQIEGWYSKECNKIKYQSQVAEHLADEKYVFIIMSFIRGELENPQFSNFKHPLE